MRSRLDGGKLTTSLGVSASHNCGIRRRCCGFNCGFNFGLLKFKSGDRSLCDDLSSDGIADMGRLGPKMNRFHLMLCGLCYDVWKRECMNDI